MRNRLRAGVVVLVYFLVACVIGALMGSAEARAVLPPPGAVAPCDFNRDGFVNGDDFDGFVAAFRAGDSAADFTGDGFVTGEDYDAFVAAFTAASPPRDAYTDLTPPAGSVVWYVSADGSDSGLGTEAIPLKSPRLAVSRLRHLSTDQVRLARGQTFVGGLGQCKAGGSGPGLNIVISSYGTGPRPIVLCREESGIEFSGGGGSPASVSNVVIAGIDFRSEGRSPGSQWSGIYFGRAGANLSIEDCSFDGFKDNVNIQGPDGSPIQNVRLYRCNVSNAWGVEGVSGHSQGVYVHNVAGFLADGCVLDHNGWSESVPGAIATIFNHNFYLTGTVSGVTIRDCITARASSHGLSANRDAIVSGNLSWRNPYHFVRTMGTEFRDNVVLESGDIGPADRGNGVVVGGVYAAGDSPALCSVVGNIFSGKTARGLNAAIQVGAGPTLVKNNIVDDWPGWNVLIDPPGVGGVVQVANEFSSPAWTRRTLDDYAHSIGLADADAFVRSARANNRRGWDTRYTAAAAAAFVRAGYGR